jgi:hypothetical protein
VHYDIRTTHLRAHFISNPSCFTRACTSGISRAAGLIRISVRLTPFGVTNVKGEVISRIERDNCSKRPPFTYADDSLTPAKPSEDEKCTFGYVIVSPTGIEFSELTFIHNSLSPQHNVNGKMLTAGS